MRLISTGTDNVMNRDIVKILVQKEKFDQVNSLLPARQVAFRIITGFRGNPIRDLAIAV